MLRPIDSDQFMTSRQSLKMPHPRRCFLTIDPAAARCPEHRKKLRTTVLSLEKSVDATAQSLPGLVLSSGISRKIRFTIDDKQELRMPNTTYLAGRWFFSEFLQKLLYTAPFFMTLMLVDDDQDDIDLFSEALREIDSSIVFLTALNGADALKILESDIFEKPDRVFLDLNMPVMNGLDCLRAIKTRLKVQVPVTIYTTSQNPGDYRKCIELGADFLSKPTNFSTLKSALRQQLQRSHGA